MDLNKITLISMLQDKMKYQAARQEVIAENIANVNTPEYKRKDITRPNFGDMVKTHMIGLEVTDPKHISGSNSSSNYPVVTSEIPVELDMEALELSKNNDEFADATTTYKKMLSLLNQALGNSK